MIALFRTSESDDKTIYRNAKGQFFCKRYGLATYEITEDEAKQQAWLECNRRGKFTHLIYFDDGDWMPKLSNPQAQNFIVSVFMGKA